MGSHSKEQPKVINIILRASESKCLNPKDLCTWVFIIQRMDFTFLTLILLNLLQLMLSVKENQPSVLSVYAW